jgi:putative MATE family efflux protein
VTAARAGGMVAFACICTFRGRCVTDVASVAKKATPALSRERAILAAPIVPTILRLAAPNALVVLVQAAVVVTETVFVGTLGRDALAANAVVFPFLVLMQTMSTGAMGGGVSSAVARALGAGDHERARAVALHAIIIALGFGLLFTVLMLALGPAIYSALGARDRVLELALTCSNWLFAGVALLWMQNTLVSLVRGTGNMRLPTAIMLGSSLLQIALGYVLTIGVGPIASVGISGIAISTLIASGIGALVTLVFLRSSGARVRLTVVGVRPRPALFFDILRVGGVAIFFSLQNAFSVMVMSGLVAGFGAAAVAGYGIGARLEMLQIPIAFGFGAALVPMVGMNVGAGQIERARSIALTGSLMAGALSGLIGLVFALAPSAWSGLYTTDAGVQEAAATYLTRVGPTLGAFGFGICLYFATQGSGRILGPVLAATGRLAMVILGALAVLGAGLGYDWLCWTVAGAMAAYGLTTFAVLHFSSWRRARG